MTKQPEKPTVAQQDGSREARGHVAVVGAGLVGLACSRALQRVGFDVTLFDPHRPGAGASHGNAGLIAGSAVVPEASRETLLGLPRMLFGRGGAVSLLPSHLPRMGPFLWHFAKACRESEFDRLSRAMAGLSLAGYDHWMALLDDAPEARGLFRRGGCLYLYLGEAEREAAEAHNRLRRERGMTLTVLSADDVHERIPDLARPVAGGVIAHEAGHVLSPGDLGNRLFERIVGQGGQFVNDAVARLVMEEDRVTAVRTRSGRDHPVDHVVLAAGAYSGPLAVQLGCRPPLLSQRGYHVMLPAAAGSTPLPILVPSLGLAVTPMRDGLRFAGLVEFAGLDVPPSAARIQQIERGIARLFPEADTGNAQSWMGRRPSLPDGVPIIDRAPRAINAHLAFGHGQMGLTQAAVTGHAIRDLVLGAPPPVDLTPYRADRFSRVQRTRHAA